jgi:hypothetical protein
MLTTYMQICFCARFSDNPLHTGEVVGSIPIAPTSNINHFSWSGSGAPPRFAHEIPYRGSHLASGLGFTARMKPLMNLLSTCGAMTSTLIPLSVRNTRASSMS